MEEINRMKKMIYTAASAACLGLAACQPAPTVAPAEPPTAEAVVMPTEAPLPTTAPAAVVDGEHHQADRS